MLRCKSSVEVGVGGSGADPAFNKGGVNGLNSTERNGVSESEGCSGARKFFKRNKH